MNIEQHIKKLVNQHDVVLFIKGSRDFPQCGFSATAVAILDKVGVDFQSVDVLSDNSLRQGIKDFSNWPTTPQLYVKGTFIGGCDIMRDMYQSGEITSLLDQEKVVYKTV